MRERSGPECFFRVVLKQSIEALPIFTAKGSGISAGKKKGNRQEQGKAWIFCPQRAAGWFLKQR